MIESVDEKRPGSRTMLWLLLGLLTLTVACTVVALSPRWGTIQVFDPAQEQALSLDWVTQDQSSLDSPMPHDTSFLSPWEHPTDVHWATLVLDVAIVWLPFAAAGLVARRWLRRRPRGTTPEHQPA